MILFNIIYFFSFFSRLTQSVVLETPFPINEFFDIPKNETYDAGEYLCSIQTFFKCCDCDSSCIWKKSCCIDKFWNTTNPISLNQYLKMFYKKADNYKDTTCEPTLPFRKSGRVYRLISKCLEDAKLEDVNGCTNVTNDHLYEYIIPVLGSDKYIYKNSFCARCNFVEEFQIVNITMNCISDDERKFELTTKRTPQVKLADLDCSFEITENDFLNSMYFNKCTVRSSYCDDCLPTSKFYKRCKVYQASRNIYLNYHCFLCAIKHQQFIDKPNPGLCDVGGICGIFPGPPLLTWSITISFKKNTKIAMRGKTEIYCNNCKLYNIFTEECDSYSCASGYINIGNICKRMPNQSIKLYSWQTIIEDINKYITYVFTSVSVICYAVIILAHVYFKELQKVPGLIITALCMTLLVTDVLVLVSSKVNDNFTACKVIGIVLHLSLLAAQLWVVILAFDLLSKFGSLMGASGQSVPKILLKYFISVVSTSTLIVGPSVILNELNVYDFGYGVNNVCFIYNLYPRVYFYIIPVCTCLLAVILSFVYVIAVIKRQEDQTRNALHNSGRKDADIFMIALKLVLSLGLIEIIGFVQISKDNLTESEEIFNATFATLYNLFRSCRGIVLFTLYILNKDKYKLLKSKFHFHTEERINLAHLHTKDMVLINSHS